MYSATSFRISGCIPENDSISALQETAIGRVESPLYIPHVDWRVSLAPGPLLRLVGDWIRLLPIQSRKSKSRKQLSLKENGTPTAASLDRCAVQSRHREL